MGLYTESIESRDQIFFKKKCLFKEIVEGFAPPEDLTFVFCAKPGQTDFVAHKLKSSVLTLKVSGVHT